MTCSVLLVEFEHPPSVKARFAGGSSDGPPLFLKIETAHLLHETTGEPAFAKLDDAVRCAVEGFLEPCNVKVLVGFAYSYSDVQGDQVRIDSSPTLQMALDDCLDDSLEICVKILPTKDAAAEDGGWWIKLFFPQKKADTRHRISIFNGGDGISVFENLKNSAAEMLGSSPDATKLAFVRADGSELAIESRSDLVGAIESAICIKAVASNEGGTRAGPLPTTTQSFSKQRECIQRQRLSSPQLLREVAKDCGFVRNLFRGCRTSPLWWLFGLLAISLILYRSRSGLPSADLVPNNELGGQEQEESIFVEGVKEVGLNKEAVSVSDKTDGIHSSVEFPILHDASEIASHHNMSSAASPPPAVFTFSHQGSEDDIFRFGFDLLVCGSGAPSHTRLVSLVAGVFHVHPTRVVVLLDGDSVANDKSLQEKLVTHSGNEIHFGVALTRPDQMKVVFQGDDSFFIVGGSTSFETLSGMSGVKYNGAPVRFQHRAAADVDEVAVTSENELLKILHNTPGDSTPKIVAMEAPKGVTLGLSAGVGTGSSCKLETDQSMRPYAPLLEGTCDAISWELSSNLAPGRYIATIQCASGYAGHGNYASHSSYASHHGSFFAGVIAPETYLNQLNTLLPKTNLPRHHGDTTYVNITTDPLDLLKPGVDRFVVAWNGKNFNLRSVALQYVGPLLSGA